MSWRRVLPITGMLFLMIFLMRCQKKSKTETQVTTKESGLMMGLIEDAGVEIVIKNCATCHSTALITQNRLTR
ncbi:MAG: hypothetical protein HQ474_05775 [Flammeovirgaceae bacterium]|jgi:hypothetical protein|nr:hypothetical protein [Flammeovirgaceae bacterium]